MLSTMLFHIALPEDFATAQERGEYTISTRGVPHQQQGFIHASATLDQVRTVWEAIYSDRDDFLILAINEDALGEHGLDVRFELGNPEDANSELFPHIYGGALPISVLKIYSSGLPIN